MYMYTARSDVRVLVTCISEGINARAQSWLDLHVVLRHLGSF